MAADSAKAPLAGSIPELEHYEILTAELHLRRHKMYQMVQMSFAGHDLSKVIQQVVSACDDSLQNDPKAKSLVPPGHQHTGDDPGDD